jgi:hypothetical protein
MLSMKRELLFLGSFRRTLQTINTMTSFLLTFDNRSTFFHTNLLHCSDLGRLAFLEAQNRMSRINSTATSMMIDGGQIGYIIELLEDLEDARLNLKPEMEELKAQASKCGIEVTQIKGKFDYWYRVILHLSKSALDIHSRPLLFFSVLRLSDLLCNIRLPFPSDADRIKLEQSSGKYKWASPRQLQRPTGRNMTIKKQQRLPRLRIWRSSLM